MASPEHKSPGETWPAQGGEDHESLIPDLIGYISINVV